MLKLGAISGMVLAAATVSALAAPIVSVPTGSLALPSNVQQVHGWHRNCAWGPARYHRHVPGIGNVPCYGEGGGYCRKWRHICADRWGWGGWEFRRCLRNHGC